MHACNKFWYETVIVLPTIVMFEVSCSIIISISFICKCPLRQSTPTFFQFARGIVICACPRNIPMWIMCKLMNGGSIYFMIFSERVIDSYNIINAKDSCPWSTVTIRTIINLIVYSNVYTRCPKSIKGWGLRLTK